MAQPTWKIVRFYEPVRKVVRGWPAEIKKELGAVLTRLQKGQSIGMPDVRPMPSVGSGAAEIRIAERNGNYRAFHVMHGQYGILVFHAFAKKTQKTPSQEITAGRLRLRAFLADLESEDAGKKEP